MYIGLLVSVLLQPQGLGANSGISYYGIFLRTVIPYAVSLLGTTFFCWQAARAIHEDNLKLVRTALFIMAACSLVIVATPYSFDGILDHLHVAAGSFLFSVQLLLSIWLLPRVHFANWAIALTTIELLSGIACALYLYAKHGFLIQFQVLFQLAFGVLLIRSLMRLQLTATHQKG